MASLTAGLKLGTGSASALIKSASSIASQIATYQDASQAYQYELSAKTDQDLQTYQTYLQGRITTLNATGTIADASKSLSLTRALSTAVKGNISTSILRENIQIMAGNATDQDKLNLIGTQFQRALSNGDMNLAQSLESQAYSLSQSIQLKAQTAADAAASLRKAAGGSAASAQNHVATQIENSFKQLNSDTGAAGEAALNKNLKSWVTANKSSLLALTNGPGIDQGTKDAITKAVNSSQPNYRDIASGVGQAMIAAHYQAYLAELPINPETAQGYLDAATNLANGNTSIKTLAGSLTLQDIQLWQNNPAMFVPKENADTGVLSFSYGGTGRKPGESAISGYKFGADGTVTANFTGSVSGTKLNQKQVDEVNNTLTKLGFNFKQIGTDKNSHVAILDNGITIQANKSPKWLQPMLAGQQNVQLQAYETKQGIVTATLDGTGKGNIYLIAHDSKGLNAVYQSTGQFKDGNPIFGKQVAHGDYGFDQNNNSLWKTDKPTLAVKNAPAGTVVLKNSTFINGHNVDTGNNANYLLDGHTFELNTLISGAQNKFYQVQQARIAEQNRLAALAAQSARDGAASIPAPHQTPIPVAKPAPRPVGQPTVNPQPASTQSAHILQPTVSGLSVQGSSPNLGPSTNGFNLNQSGTGGIRLK